MDSVDTHTLWMLNTMPSITGQLNTVKNAGKSLNIMNLGHERCKHPPAKNCVMTDCHMRINGSSPVMRNCTPVKRRAGQSGVCVSTSCGRSVMTSGQSGCHCGHERRSHGHQYKPVDTQIAINALKQILAITVTNTSCGASTVAIDNKIEQAMDLVKSHLMFAVREEVIVLKEQIKELLEKNAQLEYENNVLRAGASPETLAKLQQTNPTSSQTSSS